MPNLSTIDGFVRTAAGVPYADDAYITPEVTSNNSTNGANFLAAYAAASALTPGGSALSATNRACVMLLPGTYSWAGNITPVNFVDICGISGNRADVQLNGTWTVTTTNFNVANVSASTSGAFGGTGGTFSGTAFNCQGGSNAFGGGSGSTFSGTAFNCTGGLSAFGGLGTFSGTATNCTGTTSAFGGGASGIFSGTATNCTGGNNSFGGIGTFSGAGPKILNCVGGSGAFIPTSFSAVNVLLQGCRLTTGDFSTIGSLFTSIKVRGCINADLSEVNYHDDTLTPGNLTVRGQTELAAAQALTTGNSAVSRSLGDARYLANVGVTNGSSATAGNVGEVISTLINLVSAVACTSGTTRNVISVLLTPGDWDVDGNLIFQATSATTTDLIGGISAVSATLPSETDRVANSVRYTTTTFNHGLSIPRTRFNVTVSTTIYLTTLCWFAAGTVSAYGKIYARRVR